MGRYQTYQQNVLTTALSAKWTFKQVAANDRFEPKAIIECLRNPDNCGIGYREKRGKFAHLSVVNIWCRQMAMVFGADWRFNGSKL